MKTRIYHSIWTILCLAFLWSDVLSAHEIHLKNGKIIKTRNVEERGVEIIYESRGGSIGISSTLVEKIVYDDLAQGAKTGSASATLLAHYPLDAAQPGDRLHPGEQWTVSGARPVADRTETLKAAYRFDGIDDAILAGMPALKGPPLTISFWFKTSQIPDVGQYLLSHGAESGKEPGFYCKILGRHEEAHSRISWPKSGVQCGAVLLGDSMWAIVTTEGFSIEDWHHILFSWDDTAELRLLIDGNVRPAMTEKREVPFYGAPAILRLGTAPEDISAAAFRGALDDIRAYQGLLNSGELRDLSSHTPREPGIYPSEFDEDDLN